jgi:hypothetical protein
MQQPMLRSRMRMPTSGSHAPIGKPYTIKSFEHRDNLGGVEILSSFFETSWLKCHNPPENETWSKSMAKDDLVSVTTLH